MTEYVVDFGDKSSAFVGLAMAEATSHGATLKEQVVRCRECFYYEKDPEPIDEGWPMMCGLTGMDMLPPNGFCAWGERRES